MVRSPDGGGFSVWGNISPCGLGSPSLRCAPEASVSPESKRGAGHSSSVDSPAEGRGLSAAQLQWLLGQGDDQSLWLLLPTGHHSGQSTGAWTWLSSWLHASCRCDVHQWASLLHAGVFSLLNLDGPRSICHFSCRAVLRAKERNGWEETCKLNTPSQTRGVLSISQIAASLKETVSVCLKSLLICTPDAYLPAPLSRAP